MMSEKKNLFDCSFKGEPAAVYTVLSQPKSKNQATLCTRLENLYEKYRSVLDSDFLIRFPLETKQRYWELYLAHFLSQQFTLEPPKNNGGPDFSFKHEGQTIWIEAVAPTQGTGENRVPDLIIYEPKKNWPPVAQEVPEVKIILRYHSSLRYKAEIFQEYQAKNIVEDGDIKIIAVSDAVLPRYSNSGAWGDPYILKALFPMDDYRMEINRNSRQFVGEGYGYREDIKNANGSPVFYFFQSNEHIGGVLYHALHMGDLIWDEWENIHKNQMYFIHNPFAKNPIPRGLFQCGHEYTAEYDGDGGWRIKRTPEVI
ncbi:MAG: hypothetical protein ACK5O9_01080 [Holosporales bacterium]|jgi:hypothetical protein